MSCSLQALFLCCILGLAFPLSLQQSHINDGEDSEMYQGIEPLGAPNRCEDEEGFDAVTLDENGVMNFFKGNNDTHIWWHPNFLVHEGMPTPFYKRFPGVPPKPDAAVECPAGECLHDSILFFKDQEVYAFDLSTGKVQNQRWGPIPSYTAAMRCTAAMRWFERYYCFHKTKFYRFTPVTGELQPEDALDARDYFIRCPGRGHGTEAKKNATIMSIMDRCSNRSFDAFISDDLDRIYAIRGDIYFSLHTYLDGWHAWPLREAWKDLGGPINAAFYWDHKMYFIQGSQVYTYRADQSYTLIEGYPKPLQEELGIQDDNLDAAFSCPGSSLLYFIKGW
ncbi:hemopexin-like [Protopterus annectens]|uniref:hemopexin-like n=1 Tax=Protopterus annectens TaxID=7888 RepID=UPI001CFC2328|nr:hemopexin-like [Protopterus annectens]